jgi:hypothetical protein
MAKIRKDYRLPEETVRIIDNTKSEHGLTSETEALCFIVAAYDRHTKSRLKDKEKEEIVDAILEKFTERYGDAITRTKFASVEAERCSHLALDVLNSQLYESRISRFVPADFGSMHSILEASDKHYRKIIEIRKQRRDDKAGR